MKKVALFVGRFQPLHLGHVHALKRALSKYDLLILIGSINRKDEKNPYSYRRRREMLGRCLSKYKGRYKIIGMKDTSDKEWTKKVMKLKFDVVISGNPRVRECLPDCKMEKPAFLRLRTYNGTKIRDRMKEGKDVRNRIPKKVLSIIKTSS